MARKPKKKSRKQPSFWHRVAGWPRSLAAFNWSGAGSAGRVAVRLLVPAVLLGCGGWGLVSLEQQVNRELTESVTPEIRFVNLPTEFTDTIQDDLEFALRGISFDNWLDDSLCGEIGKAVQGNPWVSRLKHVRRKAGGIFELSCLYRRPFAMTRDGSTYYLVGRDGVRLPGTYSPDSTWPHIYGVEGPAPKPGHSWATGDLKAGIAVIERLAEEPFREQIPAVTVENYQGRIDPGVGHIQLMTDRAGGRIIWGSPPGHEMEETSAAEKIALLRANFERSGHVDGGYLVIDISSRRDEFLIRGTTP